MKKRLGKFYATTELVMSGDILPALTYMEFIPIRVEHLYHQRKFEYIGMSHLFAELDEGFLIPEYGVSVTRDENGSISVAAKVL